jgi:6-phosphogluconate dehydrogenase
MRRMVEKGVSRGIPLLAFGNALAYLDSMKLSRLPQNLTQAQRDFFGAHTFERIDKPGVFHAQW